MIINGFGGKSSYNGSGDPMWVNLATFSLTGSYTGSISGGSGDSQGYYILGSSNAFNLPNAFAFRFVVSTYKFNSGTLSRYNKEWAPAAFIYTYITNTSYTPQYGNTSGNWASIGGCPKLYMYKAYSGSSSISGDQSLTGLESTAAFRYYDNYVYYTYRLGGLIEGTSETVLTKLAYTGSNTSYTYEVGKTVYISTAVEASRYDGYISNFSATASGTLQYIPA